ncbi:hypothetical protein NJO91_23650 [Streptomyces microflavus]|uniref:hypothetical protein n=1 Tax=Streptomyces microflavus TaxID=1919 RepID=UPI0029AF6F5B|nr:hypothetical protein [Streptomyces microflavus]MDX2406105.1 hypothetical protein [Streptomyces microflavus]
MPITRTFRTALIAVCALSLAGAALWWFDRTDDASYAVSADGPRVTLAYDGERPDEDVAAFLTVFVQRLAAGDVKGVDALADGYPDGSGAGRESSDFLRPLAASAAAGKVTAEVAGVEDARPLSQRVRAPGGGTSQADLTLADGKHLRIQLAREHGVWWGYALAPAG